MPVTVLVPVYNDWNAVTALLPELDRHLSSSGRTADVLIVDDGSLLDDSEREPVRLSAVTNVEIVHLRRNLGHQRAIAIGLAYLEARAARNTIVVMDGDGEDRPEDVNRLLDVLERDGSRRIVFAERTRRSEGPVFSALYLGYRGVHRLLTGERVRVGNFCAIPAALLRTLVSVSDLWNHFAAAVFHARIPFTTIPTSRGTRYAGRSTMNFVALVTHGLSAMSVFGDRIGVRLLIIGSSITLVATGAAAVFLGWQIAMGTPVNRWIPYATLALLVVGAMMLATSLGFVFIILAGRATGGFLPFREFSHYVSHSTHWTVLPIDNAVALRRH